METGVVQSERRASGFGAFDAVVWAWSVEDEDASCVESRASVTENWVVVRSASNAAMLSKQTNVQTQVMSRAASPEPRGGERCD